MPGIQKYKRARFIGTVAVRANPSASFLKAYALDISYGGMAIQSEEALKGQIEATIFFADGKGGKIGENVRGRVIWCKPFGSFYRSGIEFDPLSPQDNILTLKAIRAFTGPRSDQPT
jgi:c-di-GMP-binding flagellar brake protein YcgR